MKSDIEPAIARVFVVGAGRLGRALATALEAAHIAVVGPSGRGEPVPATRSDVVVLCVPDAAVADAAREIPTGPVVGHCSGALTLDALGDHDGFSMHPLVTATDRGADFSGAGCAISGRTAHALAIARTLAERMHMRSFRVDENDRALYHAAASIASNYLVALEGAAERVAARVGVDRRALVHLARSALENWSELGAPRALTGPIARGDDATVARQRAAIAIAEPALLPLWDALADETRALARSR